jgi:hypothetical protein
MIAARPSRLLVAAFAMTATLTAWFSVNGVRLGIARPYASDFAAYYAIARIGITKGWDRIYDLDEQHRMWEALGPLPFYPNAQTPLTAYLVAPFTILPLPAAYGLWSAAMLAFLLGSWWLLAPGRAFAKATALTAALSFLPTGLALYLGQIDLVVIAAVTVAFIALRAGREEIAGLALVFLAVKPQLALLVPLAILLRGHRKAFLYWAAGSAVLAALVAATVHPTGIAAYLGRMSTSMRVVGPWQIQANLTVPGLLDYGALGWIAATALAAAALVVTWRRREDSLEVAFVAGLLGSMLFAPFLHAYDLVVLVPAAWLLLRMPTTIWQRTLLVLAYLAGQAANAAAVGGLPFVICEVALLGTLFVPLARRTVHTEMPAGAGLP